MFGMVIFIFFLQLFSGSLQDTKEICHSCKLRAYSFSCNHRMILIFGYHMTSALVKKYYERGKTGPALGIEEPFRRIIGQLFK